MPLSKQRKDLKIAILVPVYGRPEYTELCKEALESDKRDNYDIFYHNGEEGLRNAIIDFFEEVRGKYDILAKMDNDCIVPRGWLENIIDVFEKSDADILSPNVSPSNAAYKHGVNGKYYMPTDVIGGLWVMKAEMIEDIEFKRYNVGKIKGAISLLYQITTLKEPKMGWVADVVVEDLGHWSGDHPRCIKSKEHRDYYNEVGRRIVW